MNELIIKMIGIVTTIIIINIRFLYKHIFNNDNNKNKNNNINNKHL